MFKTVAQTALVGTAAVVLGAAALVLAAGGTASQAIVYALVLAIATRVVPVLATFPVAYWPRAGGGAPVLTAGALSRTVVREIWATMKLFFFYHPFERIVTRRDPPRIVPGETPILLVHGFFSNAGFWHRIEPFVREAGWSNVFLVNLEPPFVSIDDYARQLEKRIDEACLRSGTESIIIVAHSMGGLVARACLGSDSGRILRLICLGTPNHGTLWASLLPWVNTRQMRIDSDWLRRLNTGRSADGSIINILSEHDNIVVPQSSAAMSDATNIRLRGVGHLDMACSGEVRRAIKGALNGDGACQLDKSQ
ncbi:MAG: alpha/beta fold hydrolase [Arenicellales bacterium]